MSIDVYVYRCVSKIKLHQFCRLERNGKNVKQLKKNYETCLMKNENGIKEFMRG